eukprot:jgi/Astpho2/8702/e_gw1.00128.58.1_t
MPKSKRNRIVALTKVKKKSKEWRERLITTARNLLDEYPAVYVFKHDNLRNDRFKELREELKDTSRFCMGSTRVLQVAMGRTDADEYKANLSQLTERVRGNVGLFFTKLPRHEARGIASPLLQVELIFDNFEALDFARTGSRATETFTVPEGPVQGPLGEPLAHTLEPSLRKSGMPSRLNRGVVECVSEYTVCREGERLTPGQAALLRTFDVKMAAFKLRLLACWQAEGGCWTQ